MKIPKLRKKEKNRSPHKHDKKFGKNNAKKTQKQQKK